MGALHLAAYIRTSPEHCHICSEVRPGDVYVLQIFSYVAHPKRSPERQCSEHIFAEDGQRHRAVVRYIQRFLPLLCRPVGVFLTGFAGGFRVLSRPLFRERGHHLRPRKDQTAAVHDGKDEDHSAGISETVRRDR